MMNDSGGQKQLPVLSYSTPWPRARMRARVFRAVMLTVAILALHVFVILLFNPVFTIAEALGGGVIGTPASPINGGLTQEQTQTQYIPRAAGYLVVFLLTQWLFLSPRGSWRIGLGAGEPPPKRALVAAGFIGMLLSIGMLATLMEIPDWWVALTTEKGIKSTQHYGVIWVVMLAVWGFWSVVFYSYGRSLDRYTALRRVFRWLVGGTILELVMAAPVHAWVVHTRGDECYCQRGSWTGLAFGCTAALWLFGPGVLLLFLREKRRREELLSIQAGVVSPEGTPSRP
jgi:hypothetical protein